MGLVRCRRARAFPEVGDSLHLKLPHERLVVRVLGCLVNAVLVLLVALLLLRLAGSSALDDALARGWAQARQATAATWSALTN